MSVNSDRQIESSAIAVTNEAAPAFSPPPLRISKILNSLKFLSTEDFNQVSLSLTHVSDVINKCKQVNKFQALDFEQIASETAKIKGIYGQLIKKNEGDKASLLKPLVDVLERNVQEANLKMTSVTSQDCRNIMSFIQPSVEKEYVDLSMGKTYLNPQHNFLLQYAGGYFNETLYSSFGVNRRMKLPFPDTGAIEVCDMIFLKKHDDQIAHEKHTLWSKMISCMTSGMTVRIAQQKENSRKAAGELPALCRRWGYKAVFLAETNELINIYKYTEKDARIFHAVIFFYQEKGYNI